MRPFIGSVAACSNVAPAGTGTTDARRHDEQLRLRAALGPPRQHGGHHLVAGARRAPPPGRPTRRCRRRPCPAPTAARTPSTPRWRSAMSVGFTAAALTAIRTSPAPGSRTSRSTTRSTSGPPGSTTATARASSQPREQLRDGVDRRSGRRVSGTRARSSERADPAADEHRRRAAEAPERDVEAEVVADDRDLLRRHSEPAAPSRARPRATACRRRSGGRRSPSRSPR